MAMLRISKAGKYPMVRDVRVDDDVLAEIERKGFRVSLDWKGYVILSISLHRFAHGKPLAGHVIDHIDGDPSNNTRANLRAVSPHKNAQNKRSRKPRKDGQLLRGVVRQPAGRFIARVCVNGVHSTSKGSFASMREAHAAYLRMARALGSQLPHSSDDIDFSVLDEFPEVPPARHKANPTLATGVTMSGSSFRASIRRDRTTVHLGSYASQAAASAMHARAAEAYEHGGLAAVRALATR